MLTCVVLQVAYMYSYIHYVAIQWLLFTVDCPEVFTLGIHWERTLTKATNTHKCSDIHPSFKLSDVITRECLKNRTWAPVNVSQCVMSSDSPVVMIVIVSLDTNSSSLVKSKQNIITQEVCLLMYLINHNLYSYFA